MSEGKNLYCYNCLTKIGDNRGDFCAECGKRHSRHFGQSNELPAGTYLSSGRYFVGKSIGSGGFGITYIGYDTKLEKKILIKETFYFGIFTRNINDIDDPEPLKVKYGSEFSLDNIMKKTRKECISLSEGEGLNNIVKVYDWFSENNTAYIITEFINGCTLAERVREKGRYKWDELYSKLKPLIISLQKLHEKGIIHRDIKPQNIMIRDIEGIGEEFILIDFGLARSNETKTLASVGVSFSPGYSPYEQRSFLLRDGTYTDVYSLAATIYFALTGEDPSADMMNTLEGNFPRIKYLKGQYGVPDNVVEGLTNALNAKYEERTQTIKDLIKSFEKKGRNTVIEDPYSTVLAEENVPEPIYNAVPPTAAKNETPRQQENIQTQQDKSKEYEQILRDAKASIDLPQQKKSKTPIIAAIAAVVVIAAVIVGVTMSKGGSSEPAVDNSENTVESAASNSELDLMESDARTLNMLIKECINTYKADITTTKWNGKTAGECTIHDICVENGIDDSENYYKRTISGKDYSMIWTSDSNLTIYGGYFVFDEGEDVDGSTYIVDLLDNEYKLSALESDTATMNMLIRECINTYKADIKTTLWNGKTAGECTVHDVCYENGIDDSGDYYERTVDGTTYSMVWTSESNLKLNGGDYDNTGIQIDGSTNIVDLCEDEEDKLSALNSDIATLNMLIKECINNYKANITYVKYNGKTASECTVHDICVENSIDDSGDYYARTIDRRPYYMVWTSESNLKPGGGDYDNTGIQIDGSTNIVDLCEDEEDKLSALNSDTATMNMLIKECINNYKANITSVKYNGKTASECTVHDLCVDNAIDDSNNYYERTIDGTTYAMVWTSEPNLKLSGGDYDNEGTKINGSTKITDLADE